MKELSKSRINLVLLIVIVLAVFYPLSLFIHPLKWDMIDCALPWRFIIGESIHNGYLPSWNAYQSMGYPIHADMQSVPWYLPVWILSGILPFTLASLVTEFLFHVVIGGTGMYWLLRTLKVEATGSLVIALSYSLSGVIVGNAQHHNQIIAAAWLPFVICSFYQLLKTPDIFRCLVFSLFSWLIFTGGYPGLTFVIFYVIVIWFLVHQYQHFRTFRHFDFPVLKLSLLASVIVILLSLPQIVSLVQSLPYVNRSGGISLDSVQYGAFTPRSFVSFLFPYASVTNGDWFGTDISMTNIYFGICTLCLGILGLFDTSKKKWLLLSVFVLALMAAMGKYTPVRALLFNYVPFMNYSRFPSIFRIFAIIPFLLLAALGWKMLSGNFQRSIVYFRRIVIIFLILISGLCIYYFIKTDFHPGEFLSKGAFKYTNLFDHNQHLLFQSVIQIVILLSVLCISIIFAKNQKIWFRAFLIIVITDLALAVNLNSPYTVYAAEYSFSSINELKSNYDYGYKSIHNYKVSETDSISKSEFKDLLWRNMSNLNKHVSTSGFTSLFLRKYEYLLDSQNTYLKTVTKNKVCFIANDVRSIKTLRSDLKPGNYSSGTVYTDSQYQSDSGKIKTGTVENIKISPVEISMDIKNSDSSAFLVVLQNYYPYWKVFVNEQEKPLIIVSKAFMGVNLDKSTVKVVFRYDNPAVRYAFYISILTLIAVFAGLILNRKKV